MDAYAALKQYPQFLLRNDNKMPTSPLTGEVCNAHDPTQWVDYETAVAASELFTGTSIGFVLTDRDPFFCLDIDHCLQPDGTWSPLALELIAMLPGALVEVSTSGKALHVIGQCEQIAHKCKNTELHVEFYTGSRYIALGHMASATGDSGTVLDVAPIIARLGLQDEHHTKVAWSDGPCDEWAGPADDAELLNKAMRSGSAAQSFGGKASFADLYLNNEEILATNYPAQNDNDAYDRSSADAALAQHLAFWTGKDHTRMQRIMQQSALARPKWTKHRDYLETTISSAVARQGDVYKQKNAAPPTTGGDGDSKLIGYNDIPRIFEPFAYLAVPHAMLDKRNGAIYGPSQFKAMMGGYQFMMEPNNGRLERNAFIAYTENALYDLPKYHDSEFRPDLPVGEVYTREKHLYINRYLPHKCKTTPGDPARGLELIYRILPYGDDALILITYLQILVRFPGIKLTWAPVIVGPEGNGKSFIAALIEYVVGYSYTQRPNANKIDNKFNAWADGCLLGIIDEINSRGDGALLEALKTLITSPRITVEKKGVDGATTWNFVNLILMTNHLDGLPVTEETRRLCMLVTKQRTRADILIDFPEPNYFRDLYHWAEHEGGFEVMAHFFLHGAVDERFNPMTNCVTAPRTSTTHVAISKSMDPFQQHIKAACDEDRPGFAGGWISSNGIRTLLKELRLRDQVTPQQYKNKLAQLGYIPHPNLPRGRVSAPINHDGVGKPRLYIKEGHLAANLTTSHEISEAYFRAQGYNKLKPIVDNTVTSV